MKMTFLELRRDPGKLLDALENREEVLLSRRGKTIARITPVGMKEETSDLADHPAVGMWADRKDLADPVEHVRKLRKGRFSDL